MKKLTKLMLFMAVAMIFSSCSKSETSPVYGMWRHGNESIVCFGTYWGYDVAMLGADKAFASEFVMRDNLTGYILDKFQSKSYTYELDSKNTDRLTLEETLGGSTTVSTDYSRVPSDQWEALPYATWEGETTTDNLHIALNLFTGAGTLKYKGNVYSVIGTTPLIPWTGDVNTYYGVIGFDDDVMGSNAAVVIYNILTKHLLLKFVDDDAELDTTVN